jgi:hypothetical protein
LLLVAGLGLRRRSATDELLLAITASTVVSYHLFSHDLSVLLIPLAVTLNRFINAEATGDSRGRLILYGSALMFVAPACVSFMPHHLYLVSLPLLAFLFAVAVASHDCRSLQDGQSGWYWD